MSLEKFKSKVTYDGFEWTVKLVDTEEGYLVTATGLTQETTRTDAKGALKQKYLTDGKTVPDWLTG